LKLRLQKLYAAIRAMGLPPRVCRW
jgi:hypothetical protein